MKKIIASLLTFFLLLSFASCSGKKEEEKEINVAHKNSREALTDDLDIPVFTGRSDEKIDIDPTGGNEKADSGKKKYDNDLQKKIKDAHEIPAAISIE